MDLLAPSAGDGNDYGIEGLNLELDPDLSAMLEKYDATPGGADPREQSKKKKTWHQRRREEILHLREVVKELSETLEKAKGASLQAVGPVRGSSSLMEDLARRQLERLQMSTKENARLREVVHRHELHMKAVERAFKRKIRETNALTVFKPKLRCVKNIPVVRNIEAFSELIAGMDEVCAGLDSFFSQVKMHEVPCPGRQNNSAKYRDRNIFLEILDCYAVPFDLRQTEQAIWALKTTPVGESDHVSADYFAADESTRMKSVCIAGAHEGLPMQVNVHLAVRKYVEQDRTVFISRMLVEPIQELFAVAFKETTRLVLKRGKPSATGPTTVMQTHCRATDHETLRRGHVQCGHASWKKSPYYDRGISTWENSIAHFNLRVEDMLVRESILPRVSGSRSRVMV